MFQISNVGPTLGQLHHFSHFNPGKSLYSEERFYKGALKVYAALNNQLKKNNYIAGRGDIQLQIFLCFHG